MINHQNPEEVLEIGIEPFGINAILVIDRTVWGSTWGGLRIVPDFSKEETIAAARTMTFKYGYIGLPMGGAKASLALPDDLEESRSAILHALGEKLTSHIRSRRWIPALDMGCSIEDIQHLYQGAGMVEDLSRWTYQSASYTAWSAYFSTLAALALQNQSIKGRTFVVEGFGRVGMEYSKLMNKAGARLIALSTRRGAIVRAEGFDIDELVHLRKTQGDGFLLDYAKGEQTDPERVLELECDIAVPCSRAWAIHEGNWQKIRASVVPCAANAAVCMEVEQNLVDSGKTVITDFVANCGGVFGSILERHVGQEKICHLLEQNHTKQVNRLLLQSVQLRRCMAAIAVDESLKRIASFERSGRRILFSAGRRALPAIPVFIREPLVMLYASRSFFPGAP